MSTATLIQIADGVKTTIQTAIGGTGTVIRDWDPIIQDPTHAKTITQRTVYVIPIDKTSEIINDRAENRNVYTIGMIICDVIPGDLLEAAQESALATWLDDAVGWVDEKCFNNVASPSYQPIAGAYSDSGDITEVLKRGVVRQYGLFWSEVELTYIIDE